MPANTESLSRKLTANTVLSTIGVAGLFLVLSLVATYPLVFNLASAVAGSGDGFTFVWLLWWFKHALLDLGQSPFFTTYQFYPYGADITYDVSLLYGTLGLPLVACCGPLLAFNTLILLTFVGTGIASFLLINEVCQDKRAALIGSVYFTFSYQRLLQVSAGHLDIASTQWSPFYLLFLLRALSQENAKRRDILITALLFAIMGYTDYRLLVTMSLATLVIILYWLIRALLQRDTIAKRLRTVAIFGLISLVLLSPLLLLNATRLSDRIDPQKAMVYSQGFSTKVEELLRFPRQATLYRWLVGERKIDGESSGSVIGWTAALLLLFLPHTYRKKYKQRKTSILFWSFLALLFFALSLGPGEAGKWFSRLLPYNLLIGKPIVSFLRVPTRFFIVTQLALAVLISQSLALLFKSVPKSKKTWLGLLLGSLVFLESLQIPIRLVSPSLPREYTSLKKEKGEFVVLELPLKINDGFQGMTEFSGRPESWQLYNATVLQRPTVSGYITRLDEKTWSALRLDPFLTKIIQCQDEAVCQDLSTHDRRYLQETLKAKHITLFAPTEYRQLKDFLERNLHLEKVSQSDEYILYRILSLQEPSQRQRET